MDLRGTERRKITYTFGDFTGKHSVKRFSGENYTQEVEEKFDLI